MTRFYFWADGVESSSKRDSRPRKEDTRKVVCNKKGGMAGEIGEGTMTGGIPMADASVGRRRNVVATTQSRRIISLFQTWDNTQSSPFDPRSRTIAQVSTCVANDAARWLARYRCKLRGIRCWFFSVPAFFDLAKLGPIANMFFRYHIKFFRSHIISFLSP